MKLALFTLCITFLSGCREEAEFISEKETMIVSFRLFSDVMTKAGLNESSVPEIENLIDPKDISILLYDSQGNLISLVYDSANLFRVGLEDEIVGNLFSLGIEREKAQYGVTVAVIANFNGYLSSQQGEIPNLETLKEMTYSLGVAFNMNFLTKIPMSGFKTFSYEDIRNASIDGEPLGIELTRAFARIIIEDKLEGSYELKKAVLKKYNPVGSVFGKEESGEENIDNLKEDLEFSHGDDSKFYLYVPEMQLDPYLKDEAANIGNRCIELTFNDLTTNNEKTGYLWLAPYSNGEPSEELSSGLDETWQYLKRNHSYSFRIASFGPEDSDIPSDPEVTPIIRVIWIEMRLGKFGNLNEFINFAPSFYNTNPIFNSSPVFGRIERISYDDPSSVYVAFYYDLDMSTYDWDYQEIMYQIANRDDRGYIRNPYLSNLYSDCIKIENREVEGEERTFFWLNRPGLEDIKDTSQFELCRIYWKTTLEIVKASFGDHDYEEIKTDERGYSFIEFNINEYPGIINRLNIDYSFKLFYYNFLNFLVDTGDALKLEPYDFFPYETEDGLRLVAYPRDYID